MLFWPILSNDVYPLGIFPYVQKGAIIEILYKNFRYLKLMKGFLDFIREQGAVGLAVGFILGGAVSDLVKSIIENVINPILGIVLNNIKGLEAGTFGFFGATIKYGALISTIINFCIIAAVVYFGVKKFGLDKLDKNKD